MNNPGWTMRPVYMISGGITKFAKAHDYTLRDVPRFSKSMIDGAVGSYFSDHFTRQLKAASMVQDYLGLCPKPSKRIEGGGATEASASSPPGRLSPPGG